MFYDTSSVANWRRTGIPANNVDARIFWTGGIACVLVSSFLFLLGTRYGIGILPDSTRYMSINDKPFDAPLYPWMLMGLAATGISIEYAAKLAGLLLVGVNSALIWYLLARATNRYAYAAIGSAIIILSPQFVYLHSLAMSEPLFIFAILVTLLTLLRYWETEERTWLLACGIGVGAASLVRFTAPPLGAAIAICLLINPRHPLRQRILDACRIAVVSGSIFVLWTFASEALVGRSTGRPLQFYGNMDSDAWMSSLAALMAWLLPEQLPMAARITVFSLALAGGVYLSVWHGRRVLALTRESRVSDAMLPVVLGLFFIAYLAFMVLATSLEANLSLNTRYAFPIYVTTMIMMTIILAHTAGVGGHVERIGQAFMILAAIVLASHVVRTADRTHKAYLQGVGYASRSWVDSPTMRAVAALPADAVIYSNGPDVIAYVLKRRAHSIPRRFDLRTELDDPTYPFQQQLAQLRRDLDNGNTFIVFWDQIDFRFYLISEGDLQRLAKLQIVNSHSDGRIYAPHTAFAEGMKQ